MRVLITDGEQRAALALVRSLGRDGHEVHVAAGRRQSLAGASRHCVVRYTVPDALTDPPGFVTALEAICARMGAELLIPVSEASLMAVLAGRERFAGVMIPFPDLETVDRVNDKELVLRLAAEAGIEVPRQVVARTAAEAAVAAPSLRYPAVLKPSRSIRVQGEGARKLTVRHARDEKELRETLRTLPEYGFPLLLQERIVGPGIGIFLLLHDGECIARFSHRRLREKPPAGGVSVYRESTPMDERLFARSLSLLRKLEWSGVAMVEYKVDDRTAVPYLMEINGRFWGSLQLAIDAGVDFPVLLLRASADMPVEPVRDYRLGVRSRWWWGDVDHLLARLWKSNRELALPPDAPSRLSEMAAFIKLWRRGDCNEVLRLSDPMPFLRETADWLSRR